MDINCRQKQLTHLQNYLMEVDAEVTMILQNFQWDRKQLIERKGMTTCSYDTNHRVPPDKLMEHEKGCFLKSQGYIEADRFLPSPVDAVATTLVTLSAENIMEIINNASQHQPIFQKGAGCRGPQPLTLERLQATYTADERRAIHDAVVLQVPSCHDLSDLALLSSSNEVGKETETKSKLEILAELRDLRRRRTKYRVAANTRNYSDVLRDVITTQMELYSQTHPSVSVTQVKSIPDNDSNRKGIPRDNHTTRYYDENSNRRSHSTERQASSVKDTRNKSRHSGHHEEHENRTRRHSHSDRDYNCSSGYSKTRDHIHYDRKSRRRNDADDFHNRKRHLDHDRYDSSNGCSGKDYSSKNKTATEEHNLNSISEKRKATCYDYSKSQDRHYGYEKYRSNRVKQEPDHYRNTELRSTSKNEVHREKRHEYKQTQNQTVRIKKEEDGYSDDDDSGSSEDSDTEDSNTISNNSEKHYSGLKKIKVENDVTLKQEGNNKNDHHSTKYGSKYSQTCYEIEQSKVLYNCNSTNEKYKRYEKYKERTKYRNIREQQYRETVIEKIKVERDRIYNKAMDTDEDDRNIRTASSRYYDNRDHRDRSRDDKFRMDKAKDKEKTHRKY